jgi:hypothetical protein
MLSGTPHFANPSKKSSIKRMSDIFPVSYCEEESRKNLKKDKRLTPKMKLPMLATTARRIAMRPMGTPLLLNVEG